MESVDKLGAALVAANVTMTAEHVPTKYDPKSKEWQHIAWKVTIKSPRGEFTTDYNQGIGYLPESLQVPFGERMTVWQAEQIELALKTGTIPHPMRGVTFTGRKLEAPRLADVIGCLVLDADAIDYATFEEWASDTGYDQDSRKAEEIYNACRQTALNLLRVLGAKLLEEIRPLCAEL